MSVSSIRLRKTCPRCSSLQVKKLRKSKKMYCEKCKCEIPDALTRVVAHNNKGATTQSRRHVF